MFYSLLGEGEEAGATAPRGERRGERGEARAAEGGAAAAAAAAPARTGERTAPEVGAPPGDCWGTQEGNDGSVVTAGFPNSAAPTGSRAPRREDRGRAAGVRVAMVPTASASESLPLEEPAAPGRGACIAVRMKSFGCKPLHLLARGQ